MFNRVSVISMFLLLYTHDLIPVIFNNATHGEFAIYLSSEPGPNSKYTEVVVNHLSRIEHQGAVASLYIKPMSYSRLTIALPKQDLSPELTRYLLEHPKFEIQLIKGENSKLQLKPSLEELKELVVKEHQAKVRPKIQEATQLPPPVANIAAEYCAPDEAPKE